MSNGKLRPVKPMKLIKALTKRGFVIKRQKGSHVFLEHPDGRRTTILLHGNEELRPEILVMIMKDLGMSREDFFELLAD